MVLSDSLKNKSQKISTEVLNEIIYGNYSEHKGLFNSPKPVKYLTNKYLNKTVLSEIQHKIDDFLSKEVLYELAKSTFEKSVPVQVVNNSTSYLQCVSREYKYLQNENIFNVDNIGIARGGCLTNSLLNNFVPKTFLTKFGYEGFKTGVAVSFENQYNHDVHHDVHHDFNLSSASSLRTSALISDVLFDTKIVKTFDNINYSIAYAEQNINNIVTIPRQFISNVVSNTFDHIYKTIETATFSAFQAHSNPCHTGFMTTAGPVYTNSHCNFQETVGSINDSHPKPIISDFDISNEQNIATELFSSSSDNNSLYCPWNGHGDGHGHGHVHEFIVESDSTNHNSVDHNDHISVINVDNTSIVIIEDGFLSDLQKDIDNSIKNNTESIKFQSSEFDIKLLSKNIVITLNDFATMIMNKVDCLNSMEDVALFIKNFKNMTNMEKFANITSKLIDYTQSFVCDFPNPMIESIGNVLSITNGHLNLKNVVWGIISYEFGFPLTSVSSVGNFLTDFFKGRTHIKCDLKMLLKESINIIISYIEIPIVSLIFKLYQLEKIALELITHRWADDIGGIQGIYTERLSFAHFEKQHKVMIDNDFFDIHVSSRKYHKTSAIEDAERQFREQAFDKVYEKMGVPYEMFDKEFTDVVTELDKWNLGQYQENCARHWLESQKDILTDVEYKQLEMKMNLTTIVHDGTWYSENANNNIFTAFKNLITGDYNKEEIKNLSDDDWMDLLDDISNRDNSDQILSKYDGFVNSSDYDIYKNIDAFGKTLMLYRMEEKYNIDQKSFEEYIQDADRRYMNDWKNNYIDLSESSIGSSVVEYFRNLNKHYHTRKWIETHPKSLYNPITSESQSKKSDLPEWHSHNYENFINRTGEYSTMGVVYYVNSKLFNIDLSLQDITSSSYAFITGFSARTIAYLDVEIKQISKNPKHVIRYAPIIVSGVIFLHLNKVIARHIITTSKLFLNLSAEIMDNYVSPFIGFVSGFGVNTLFNYISDPKNFSAEKAAINGVKSVLNNGVVYIWNHIIKKISVKVVTAKVTNVILGIKSPLLVKMLGAIFVPEPTFLSTVVTLAALYLIGRIVLFSIQTSGKNYSNCNILSVPKLDIHSVEYMDIHSIDYMDIHSVPRMDIHSVRRLDIHSVEYMDIHTLSMPNIMSLQKSSLTSSMTDEEFENSDFVKNTKRITREEKYNRKSSRITREEKYNRKSSRITREGKYSKQTKITRDEIFGKKNIENKRDKVCKSN